MNLVSVLVLLYTAATTSAFGPSTVSKLDVNAYTGRWFQMYSAPLAAKTFEKNAACVTADYSLDEEVSGRINLINQQTSIQDHGSAIGSVDGYAYAPNTEAPGKLKVHFNDGKGAPFDVPYWILKTGPVIDGQYEYAIVSDKFKVGLFVLARNVETFESNYESDVLEQLKELGFNSFINNPVKTYHGSDCAYGDLKSLIVNEVEAATSVVSNVAVASATSPQDNGASLSASTIVFGFSGAGIVLVAAFALTAFVSVRRRAPAVELVDAYYTLVV